MEIPLQKSIYLATPVEIGKIKCMNILWDVLVCLEVTLRGSGLLAFIFEF